MIRHERQSQPVHPGGTGPQKRPRTRADRRTGRDDVVDEQDIGALDAGRVTTGDSESSRDVVAARRPRKPHLAHRRTGADERRRLGADR